LPAARNPVLAFGPLHETVRRLRRLRIRHRSLMLVVRLKPA
jgi:hypothetical protein